MNCDKVTTINNQSWLSVHVYVTKNWERIPILFNLQMLKTIATFDNLTSLIVKSLVEHGGLNEMGTAKKLIWHVKSNVTIQLMLKHSLYYVYNVHCMLHCTNLVVQTLSGLSFVLLFFTHNCFAHFPKQHVELIKLIELLECKGKKIIKNVRIQSVSMLSLSQKILDEYHVLGFRKVQNSVDV